jgi:capsule polysaccharide export protein KpsE/RkpR
MVPHANRPAQPTLTQPSRLRDALAASVAGLAPWGLVVLLLLLGHVAR